MLFLGIVIGLLIGAGLMHLKDGKKVSELNKDILKNVKNLQDVQAKLKSTRSQLYRKRSTYKKKGSAGSNGKKKATRKKTTQHVKKTKVKKAIKNS